MTAISDLRAAIDAMPDGPVPAYECGECQDSGMLVRVVDGIRRASQCVCRQRKGLEARMRLAGIPSRYAEVSFENFSTAGTDKKVSFAAGVMRKAVEDFLMHPRGQGYLLTGTCGVGKTHLAAAALRSTMIQYGVRGKFWDMADLLTEVKASFRRLKDVDEDATESAIVREFANVDVLVVDELGGERLTDWSDSEMRLLLNGRYNAGGAKPKLTIFTTNFPNLGAGEGSGGAETLGDRLGARMFSRMQELCRPLEMVGADYRRKRA